MSIRPLSSYNVCYQIQQDICDIMNKSPVILSAGIEFIAEDSQSIDYQIKESLKKQGMAAVVMTPSLDYLGHNGTSEAYQMNDLTIEFVEYTPINRASNRAVVCTGNDLANYTSELLGGPNAVIGFGKLCPNGIEQGEDGGLLVTKLTFRTYIENGDTGPIIYVPFVTKDEMEQYVGDGKLVFTKDGQEIGKFTANQKTDISVEIPNGGVWGQITGNIEDQEDLIQKLNEKASQEQVDAIEQKIPASATSENQLADKAFVNSSINNYAAFYLTKNANGDAFGTYGEMRLTSKFWNAGVEKTPTKNDYLVVLEDETKTTALGVRPTTRYVYQGEWPTGQFEFQYIVNNTSLTQAQVDAINSGITKSIVDSRVIPSTTHPGYAINAEYALYASDSEWADNAGHSNNADLATTAENAATASKASTADTALTANIALTANYAAQSETANTATTANTALSANTAITANTALSANYAPDYTPLSTFNETLGNLASIIHEI